MNTAATISPQLYEEKLSEYGRVIVPQTSRGYQLALYTITSNKQSGFVWLHDKEWCGVNEGGYQGKILRRVNLLIALVSSIFNKTVNQVKEHVKKEINHGKIL